MINISINISPEDISTDKERNNVLQFLQNTFNSGKTENCKILSNIDNKNYNKVDIDFTDNENKIIDYIGKSDIIYKIDMYRLLNNCSQPTLNDLLIKIVKKYIEYFNNNSSTSYKIDNDTDQEISIQQDELNIASVVDVKENNVNEWETFELKEVSSDINVIETPSISNDVINITENENSSDKNIIRYCNIFNDINDNLLFYAFELVLFHKYNFSKTKISKKAGISDASVCNHINSFSDKPYKHKLNFSHIHKQQILIEKERLMSLDKKSFFDEFKQLLKRRSKKFKRYSRIVKKDTSKEDDVPVDNVTINTNSIEMSSEINKEIYNENNNNDSTSYYNFQYGKKYFENQDDMMLLYAFEFVLFEKYNLNKANIAKIIELINSTVHAHLAIFSNKAYRIKLNDKLKSDIMFYREYLTDLDEKSFSDELNELLKRRIDINYTVKNLIINKQKTEQKEVENKKEDINITTSGDPIIDKMIKVADNHKKKQLEKSNDNIDINKFTSTPDKEVVISKGKNKISIDKSLEKYYPAFETTDFKTLTIQHDTHSITKRMIVLYHVYCNDINLKKEKLYIRTLADKFSCKISVMYSIINILEADGLINRIKHSTTGDFASLFDPSQFEAMFIILSEKGKKFIEYNLDKIKILKPIEEPKSIENSTTKIVSVINEKGKIEQQKKDVISDLKDLPSVYFGNQNNIKDPMQLFNIPKKVVIPINKQNSVVDLLSENIGKGFFYHECTDKLRMEIYKLEQHGQLKCEKISYNDVVNILNNLDNSFTTYKNIFTKIKCKYEEHYCLVISNTQYLKKYTKNIYESRSTFHKYELYTLDMSKPISLIATKQFIKAKHEKAMSLGIKV